MANCAAQFASFILKCNIMSTDVNSPWWEAIATILTLGLYQLISKKRKFKKKVKKITPEKTIEKEVSYETQNKAQEPDQSFND